MNEDAFQLTKDFKGYVSKPEITDLAPNFLVRGSKNVLVDYAQRVISRAGFTLFGAASNGGSGIKSSYEWATSTGSFLPVRVYDGRIEFYWNSTWNLLKSALATSIWEFAKVWDNTEKIDVMLGVCGEANTYKWSGAVAKIASATGTTITKQGVLTSKTTIAFVAGVAGTVAATITDSANGFLTAGFAAGDTLYVAGSTANSRNFTIGSVTAGVITLVMSDSLTSEVAGPSITLHNGAPTWAAARFLTTGTRKIVYGGVEYAYTGGENTDTLTGLTAFPAAAVGDPLWQSLLTLANPGSITTGFKQDLIGVQLNQVVLASTKSREVFLSSTTDYTNFTLTSPRAAADPAKVTMDDYPTCIVPIDNEAQTTSSLMFGAGTDSWFQFLYQMSQDNTNELVRMIKLHTSAGSGLIAKGAIVPVKYATAYISREPALDTLQNLAKQDSSASPISDPIKDDFDQYDFGNAHARYWKRAIYIALPNEGIVLIYDLMRKLWQPPQYIPVSRLAIINDWLYGHSSVANETYKLFTGTNDNGAQIPQRARFAYNNGGKRDRIKNMNEYWSDGYITPGGVLDMNMNLGFAGTISKRTMTISGNDTDIVTPLQGSMLGDEPLGATPIGGATLADVPGIPDSTLLRFWQADTMKATDYTEFYVEYSMDTLDGQFALVAHGCNQWDAGTSPVSHKK